MAIAHLFLEIHCFYDLKACKIKNPVPQICKYGIDHPGYHCWAGHCKYLSWTDAPHEIAYSGALSEIAVWDDTVWVGFGGDMEPDGISDSRLAELLTLWEAICRKKIKEAYDVYMDLTVFERFHPSTE
jgi:hypothetical protein